MKLLKLTLLLAFCIIPSCNKVKPNVLVTIKGSEVSFTDSSGSKFSVKNEPVKGGMIHSLFLDFQCAATVFRSELGSVLIFSEIPIDIYIEEQKTEAEAKSLIHFEDGKFKTLSPRRKSKGVSPEWH